MTDDLKTNPEADLELEGFFQQARQDTPVPSADLLSRIASDAAMTQAKFAKEIPQAPDRRMSWWAQFFEDIGGLPALGGLTACACVGVYLGFVNPEFATTWAGWQEDVEADGVMSHALLGDVYWIEEG
ncbi:hypothetical protein [uncultured Litoreibacter sp.]|uniref:hypothetical protein n=1 Tax=uncultured Litoreibacter sp. TaxID=1392394 RepID=UPI0026244621|nr:hypothetical protein [uncultured Litoreibacter sp.]